MSKGVLESSLGDFQTKGQLVYKRLLNALLSGEIGPGERINVDEVARGLEISKIPIREALQRLELQGLVVQTPHAGVRAAPMSVREVQGIFLIRIQLEPMAARGAAENLGDVALAELSGIDAEMRAGFDAGDFSPMSRLNRRFHLVIADAAGYQVLRSIIDMLLINVQRYRVAQKVSAEDWREVLADHKDILAALKARKPAAAEGSMRHHLTRSLDLEMKRQLDRVREDVDSKPNLHP